MRIALLLVLLSLCSCDMEGRSEYNAGVAFYDLREYEKAVESFQEAIRKNPNLAEAHQGLAECYVLQEKLEEAQSAYKTAQKLYEEGHSHDTPIGLDKKKSRIIQQLDWLEVAIVVDKENPSSLPEPETLPEKKTPATNPSNSNLPSKN